MTSTLINTITGTPQVRDLEYRWLVNHLPTRAELVECFSEGCPHHMEIEGMGSFQMHDLSNDAKCIYHILVSHILPMLSLTMITIERAHCLYTLLTEYSSNFGSLVTSMMMLVQLMDPSTAFPYRALITQIVEHAEVSIAGMRELTLKKVAVGAHFLNASNTHL